MKDLEEFLVNNFSLQETNSSLDSESSYLKYLHKALSERIVFFIRTDMDKLMQALYRIDVDDRESNKAFNLGEINLIANKLSELIIKRQLKKLEYSQDFYRNNIGGDGEV